MAKKKKKAEQVVTEAPVKTPKEKAPIAAAPDGKIVGSPVRNLLLNTLLSIVLGAILIGATLAYVGSADTIADIISSYFGYLMGGVVAIFGIIYIIIYFTRTVVGGCYRSEFAIGVGAIVLGAYIAVGGLLFGTADANGVKEAAISASQVYSILGILVLADGLIKCQYAMDELRMHAGGVLVLIVGILGLAVGVVTVLGVLFDLGISLGLGGALALGAGFAVNGILDLIALIAVAVSNGKMKRAEAEEPAAAPAYDVYYAPQTQYTAQPQPDFPAQVDGSAFSFDEPAAEAPAEN